MMNPLRRCRQPLAQPTNLQIVFTVPILLQLIAAVGLVGYLSFRNGQKAVQDLASQLRSEISARIERELQGYFSAPHAINQLNATAFASGDLDIVTATQGENLLFQQMRTHPTIALAYCGSAKMGEFFGVLRSPKTGELEFSYGNASNDFIRDYYSLDVRGNRMHWLYRANRTYDSRQRPWYRAAVAAERPSWTDVYIAFTTGLPNVTASLPVYDITGRELLGVCATDVVLPEEFHQFLSNLKIGKSGEAFVLDRSGHLISSSTDEPLMIGQGENAKFLKAIDSRTPLVQKSAQYLLKRFGRFDRIQQAQQLDIHLNGQRQFLQVLPFRDGYGLDWLIVVAVPEADFMAQINANTRTTALLCALALAVAMAIGVWLTRWITAPIVQLNAAAKEVAKGNWDKTVPSGRADEVGELARSFNSMTEKLRESFQTLEAQKDSFARFFPPEYLIFLNKQSVTDIELGDHVSKEMAIMFSDIRLFTSLSEKMAPHETFDFINDYLQRISPEIRSHNGFVVKFIGDGMMAVFPGGADDALAAGVAKCDRVREYNRDRQAQGYLPIEVGAAIHIGHMMLGMIGEHNRIQGDALSDAVNLTARLEGLTKHYGVSLMVSESVLSQLRDRQRYQFRFLDRAIVKGRTEPIAVYEVLTAEVESLRALKLQTLPDFEQGLQHYFDRQLTEAERCFNRVLAVNPVDKTAKLYLDRIAQWVAQGIPENWTGVWAFTQK